MPSQLLPGGWGTQVLGPMIFPEIYTSLQTPCPATWHLSLSMSPISHGCCRSTRNSRNLDCTSQLLSHLQSIPWAHLLWEARLCVCLWMELVKCSLHFSSLDYWGKHDVGRGRAIVCGHWPVGHISHHICLSYRKKGVVREKSEVL